jgi:predicted NAD/FAD-dependent oxidoreductase
MLEMDLPDIAATMVPLLCERLDIATDCVTHAAAHRWRYARVSNPLGQPFASLPNETLYLGGNWCIGPKIEAVFISCTAIVTDLLKRGLC